MGFEPMKSVSRTCAPHYMQAIICVRATGLPPHLGHRVRTRGFAAPATASCFGKKDRIQVAPLSPICSPAGVG